MSPRRRLAAGGLIVAVLAVLAVGSFVVFGGRGDSGGKDAVAGSQAAPSSLNTGSSSPELKNTGEDWDQIVRSIVAYEHWLFTHPNPDLLSNTELPSYSLFADRQLGLRNLATKGWRYDPPRRPLPVEIVRLNQRTADNVAVIFVRFGPTPATRVVDRGGAVVQDTPETPPNAVLWTLVREPATDLRWRLSKVTPFTDRPGPG
jgi:hypothetical protein